MKNFLCFFMVWSIFGLSSLSFAEMEVKIQKNSREETKSLENVKPLLMRKAGAPSCSSQKQSEGVMVVAKKINLKKAKKGEEAKVFRKELRAMLKEMGVPAEEINNLLHPVVFYRAFPMFNPNLGGFSAVASQLSDYLKTLPLDEKREVLASQKVPSEVLTRFYTDGLGLNKISKHQLENMVSLNQESTIALSQSEISPLTGSDDCTEYPELCEPPPIDPCIINPPQCEDNDDPDPCASLPPSLQDLCRGGRDLVTCDECLGNESGICAYGCWNGSLSVSKKLEITEVEITFRMRF